jgi:hypothetical protein
MRMIPVETQRMVNATILMTTHLKMTMSAMEKVKMKFNVSPFEEIGP